MTVEEIRSMYRESANPKKQIGILADLNMVSKEEIKRIISGARCIGKGQERKKMMWTSEMEDKLSRLYLANVPRIEIARLMGIDYIKVQNKISSKSFKEIRQKKKMLRGK